uniref:Uncharacterized protein n=1 Tax=Brassica campestris TaxID=3711 RepID=A0A3P5YDU5_BRACM|nr:unnamed protein product [Brassica rapa]
MYRVEMSIADETVEGLFVCFDVVMTKLHNMRAYEACHLLVYCIQRLLPHAGDGVNPWDTQAPPSVADMEGKTYKFQGGDDDNGDDNSGAISVRVKVETGGISQVQGSSGIKKKARTA